MALVHKVTYQGVPCRAVSFTRTVGLRPDFGWVEIDAEDLGKVDIQTFGSLWRSSAGIEFGGPISIAEHFRIKSGGHATFAAGAGAAAGGGKGGLQHFGALKLETSDDASAGGAGADSGSIEYSDIYVDSTALEEITQDLDGIRSHSIGTVRVPLTDIRRYYRDHSPHLTRINSRLRGGAMDPYTVKTVSPCVEWTAKEVFEFLFDQLPGSPIIRAFPDDVPAPFDVNGEGEPIVDVLQDLLEKNRLDACFQPDGSYVIEHQGTAGLGIGDVATGHGGSDQATLASLRYETKSVTIQDRAPSVVVLGRRRVRRMTLPYVPVFEDTDGRIRRLIDVGKLWGYTLDQVNAQVLAGGEKRFDDVLPAAVDNYALHFQRRGILQRCAYTMYAPSVLFDPKAILKCVQPGAAVETQSIPSLGDSDFEKIPFLPMVDAPYYTSELDAAGRTDAIASGSVEEKGDKGNYVLLPPQVYSTTFTQTFVARVDKTKAIFAKLIEAERKRLTEIDKLIQHDEAEIVATAKHLTNHDVAKKTVQNIRIRGLAGGAQIRGPEPSTVAQLDAGVAATLREMGISNTLAVTDESEGQKGSAAVQQAILFFAHSREAYKTKKNEISQRIDILETQFKAFLDAYDKIERGVQLWTHEPRARVPRGSFTLDVRTGIVIFPKPRCVMDQPFVLEQESVGRVLGDADVSVTFGYELKNNLTSDWTAPIFFANGAGVLYPVATPLKPKVLRAPTLRLFEDDRGTPFNAGNVYAEAASIARRETSVPAKIEGFAYDVSGFRRAVLRGGTKIVRHEWTVGDDRAHTVIEVNMTGSRLAGASRTFAKARSPAAEVRKEIGRQQEID